MNTGSTGEFDDTTMFENKNALEGIIDSISDIIFKICCYFLVPSILTKNLLNESLTF